MECFIANSAVKNSAAHGCSLVLSAFAVALALGTVTQVAAAPAAAAAKTAIAPNSDADWKQFQKNVQPFLAKNCYECHGAKDSENDFRLDVFTNSAALANGRKSLADAYGKLLHGEMPPKKKPRPAPAQLNAIVGWLESHLDVGCNGPVNPGRVTLRRLNRAEFNNTIRDLLGVEDLHPADSFPTDMSGYGFDNNGDVLSIAPVLMEKYLSAADLMLGKVINAEPVVPAPLHHVDAVTAEGTVPKTIQTTNASPVIAAGANAGAGRGRGSPVGRLFNQRGEIYDDYVFPKDGTYILRLRAYGTAGSANRERPAVAFYLDGEQVEPPVTIPQDFRNVGVTSLKPVHITAGKHRVTLTFVNGPTAEEVAAAEAAALTNAVIAPTNAVAPVNAPVASVTAAASATNLVAAAGGAAWARLAVLGAVAPAVADRRPDRRLRPPASRRWAWFISKPRGRQRSHPIGCRKVTTA